MTDNDISIRKKVAELCGYSDIHLDNGMLGQLWKGSKDGLVMIIPFYELSLDAIAKAFDEHGFTYILQKGTHRETSDINFFASKDRESYVCGFSDTAAKAMCYLFIHLIEGQA